MTHVVEDTQFLAGEHDDHRQGYIIAFLHRPHTDITHTDPKYRTLFAQWRKGAGDERGTQIIGGSLGAAFVFPTYQAAATAAVGWGNTSNPKAGTRIIRVRTRARFEIFEDYPINLCDVLAEL